MKKKFIRIIGLVLLLILAIQTFCFADIIAPNEPRKPFKPITNNDTIEITKGQLALLILLIAIAFISLFVVTYYFISKYSSNNRPVYGNSENTQEESDKK